MEIGTIRWFGGHRLCGVALTLEMTGGVVSLTTIVAVSERLFSIGSMKKKTVPRLGSDVEMRRAHGHPLWTRRFAANPIWYGRS